MSILQQIVHEATSATCDVTRMLRLCQVLAARLGHERLKLWVRSELEGYESDADLPPYRILGASNKGHFVGRNYQATYDIPMSALPEELQREFEVAPLYACIAEYVDLAHKAGGNSRLQIPWPVELAVLLGSRFVSYGQCISAWREISPSDLIGMIDQIKTRVLGFALDIEGEAPDAGNIPGVTFSVAHDKVTQFFMTNIQGNIGVMQTGGDATTNVTGMDETTSTRLSV